MKKLFTLIAVVVSLGLVVSVGVSSAEENLIPSWIKTTASFWVDDQIGDAEFIQALEFMIENDIIKVSQKDPELVELEQEMQKQILQNLLEKENEVPAPVEISYECIRNLGDWEDVNDHGYTTYTINIANFDSVKHSALITVTDETEGGNILDMKIIDVELEPNEQKQITREIVNTAFSDSFCHVRLAEVN